MYLGCGGNGAFEGAFIHESIYCFIIYILCMCALGLFFYDDFVKEACDVVYYGSHEEFVLVIVLGSFGGGCSCLWGTCYYVNTLEQRKV